MIKLAYCDVSDLDVSESYPHLSEDRKGKVDNFRFVKDKRLSAGAYLLLKKLLNELNITDPIFRTGKYGKAYIVNYKNIYFNLSHSGRFVACAISDAEVGVDVEYNDSTIDLNIAKHYFFNTEYESIMKSENPSDEFFKYWVLKESYMKYTGLGFNLELDEFEIIIKDEIKLKNDKNNLKFNLFDIEDYKLAICSQYDVKKVAEYTINDIN